MFLPLKNKTKNNQQSKNKVPKKNIRQTNKSNKVCKNCCLSRYKTFRSNKIKYILVPPKYKIRKQ